MNGRTHIDLFSGIGGFALAAGWAGLRTVAFCEIEPYCQAILAARFGAVTHSDAGGCQPDIREAVSGWQGAPVPNPESCGGNRGGDGLQRQGIGAVADAESGTDKQHSPESQGGCHDTRQVEHHPVPRAAIEELEKVRQNWRESVDRRRGNEGIDRWDDAMDQAIRAVVGEGK